MPKSVTKQHRGGLAGMRGSDFERFFATYRILFAMHELERGGQVAFAVQLRNSHVDDWAEDRKTTRSHFQLKRTKSLGWGAVRADFEAQVRVRVPGKRLTLALVVPTKSLARKLKNARRPVAGVNVVHFPGWTTPDEHIRSGGPGRSALIAACFLPRPTRTELETIWSVVSFAWENVRKPGVFVPARLLHSRLKDQRIPIRRPWTPTAAWSEAAGHLRRIRDLSVEVRSGSLLFSTNGGIAGMISCTSAAFRRFVNAVNRKRPSNVESLLELMP